MANDTGYIIHSAKPLDGSIAKVIDIISPR